MRDHDSIERFDLRKLSDEGLRELHAHEQALSAELDPDDPPRPFANYAASVRSMPTFFEIEGFLIRDGSGEVSGKAEAVFFLTRENAHLTQVDLTVRPDRRRLGFGRALLNEVVGAASARDRTLLIGATNSRIPSGEAFARHFNARPEMTSRISTLPIVNVDKSLIRNWITDGPARAPGYSLLKVDGHCPDELVEQVVDLMHVMNEAPGSDSVEDRQFTVEQFREAEHQHESVKGINWRIFATDNISGKLVGFTDVSWNPSLPETISQGNTGVLPEHRGHALGKWMKAAMLERILHDLPQVLEVETNNAESNAAMLGINDQLGFKAEMAQTTWLADVGELRAHFAAE